MKKFFFLLLLLYCAKSFAQTSYPLDVILDDLYIYDFERTLEDISKQHHVKFSYDHDRARKIAINHRPMKEPLGSFLSYICNRNKLKYYVGDDSTIYIVEKWDQRVAYQTNFYTPTSDAPIQMKNYNLIPKRFDITVSGKVIDQKTGETLPFVNIIVSNTYNGTSTNIDGYFTLVNVHSDTVTLELSYIGYRKQKFFLTPDSKINNLLIELQRTDRLIDEVVVVGEKQDILQTNQQVGMLKMSPLKLNVLPNLGEKDVFRSFQLMPGISAANENSSGLYVRGGTPDQVLVQYDGFTVYNVEHLFGFFSAFNSNAIKDIQLYKGGFDSKYGGRLSSVVEITGKHGNSREFNAGGDVSMLAVNAFAEFPIANKFTAFIAARRSWKSALYNKIFEQFAKKEDNPMADRFRTSSNTSVASYFYDINSKITYRPSNKDILALSIYNGADNLDNSLNPDAFMGRRGGFSNMNMQTNDITDWGNTGVSLKWARNWSSKLYSNMLLSYSNYYSDRDRTSEGSFVNRDGETENIKRGLLEKNNLNEYNLKGDFTYKLFQNNDLDFGFQVTQNAIAYSYSQNDTFAVISRNTNGNISALYAQDKASFFKNKLNISAGLRYNYFNVTQKSYIEPRTNFSLQLTKQLKLKGSFGKYNQFAKRVIREDIMQGSRDFWVLADDEKLPVSSSFQYILGFAYETNDYLFDVEAYYKTMTNLSEYSLRIMPRQGELVYDENFFTGSGLAKGIDFLFQKKVGNFSGWIGYTLGQVSNRYDAYGNYDFYAANDVTHEAKLIGSYKWHDWDFAATWIYATGKPYTIPEGGYQLTLLDGTVRDYINVSAKNSSRLPDYQRLDLSATYNFNVAQTVPCSISLSIFNAYNRKNVWYKEYQIIENEIIETDMNYLGITPNISLVIKLK